MLAVDIDESRHGDEPPVEFVSRLAAEKASAGFSRQQGQLPSLGADTIVVCNGQIFGKPQDSQEAEAMLLTLSGNVHSVYTAVAVDNGQRCALKVSETLVHFRTITPQECPDFGRPGTPGKAGAYAIQGRAGIFVEKLEGSYSGVVGLPLAEAEQLLAEFSVPCWNSGEN